jgi:hypothetical protein
MKPIRVNAKTLAHISSGLYRSTAGALKELVSNAFDADATKVYISTNRPSFNIFSCSDNGGGIHKDNFEQLMEGGIGFSDKRRSTGLTALGRPIIGRLGIGLLAMTQLSHGFKVVSHHRESATAFEAEVIIRDYLLSEVDKESKVNEPTEIGQYNITEIKYDANKVGVTIVSDEMRTGLIRRFRESSEKDLPLKFTSFLKQLQKLQSISRQGPYWDLVWGLSVYCPVRYPVKGPVPGKRVLTNIQQELRSYNFELSIDGMPILKPIAFPISQERSEGLEYFVKEINYNDNIEGRKLRFQGYIYAQEGKSITPIEYRGILIRIRNVAIGAYDKTFLDYEIAEGPRFGWLSSEIYVNEGLEDALNVDRDSFNVSHPHYLKLREVLHSDLQKVFSDLYRGIDRRSVAKKDQQRIQRKTDFIADLQEILGIKFSIKRSNARKFAEGIEIDRDSGEIILSEHGDWPRTEDKRQFLEQLLIAWEIASAEDDIESRRNLYIKLTTKILKNYKRW